MYKFKAITTIVFLMLLSVSALAGISDWSGLSPDEEYMEDFVIKPNEVKSIEIISTKKLSISFMVNIDDESMKTIKSGPFPIEMADAGSKKKIAAFWGGINCVPIKGKIQIAIINHGYKEYKVVIVKLKKLKI